jgi:hypothetical protein
VAMFDLYSRLDQSRCSSFAKLSQGLGGCPATQTDSRAATSTQQNAGKTDKAGKADKSGKICKNMVIIFNTLNTAFLKFKIQYYSLF